MKKIATLCMLTLLISFVSAVNESFSQEKVLDAEITQMVVRPDKNGKEYVRFIIKEDRQLNGINYQAEVDTMVFGSAVQKAKKYKPGDTLRAIVKVKNWHKNKKTYYQILQFLE
jgi:hypothetical protein